MSETDKMELIRNRNNLIKCQELCFSRENKQGIIDFEIKRTSPNQTPNIHC